MNYRTLPKSGIKLSTIGIGSGSVHESDEKQTMEFLDFAETQGVNLIDLALSYAQPLDNYGKALKGRRDKFHTQMHLGITFENGEYERNYSLESVKRSFESQLKKIGTDYTDMGLFHCVDTEQDFNSIMNDGVFDYALQMKKAGVIKNLGFASHTVDIARKFIETGEIEAFMFSINAAYDFDPAKLDPYSTDTEKRDGITVSKDREKLYQECVKKGIGITVMKAYGGGKLLSDKSSPFGRALTIPQCIQYALDRPGVLSCLLGIRNKKDLADAVRFYSTADEERDYSFISALRPKELMGSCVYCNHCMPCPKGIDIGQTNKFVDLYLSGDEMAMEHYRAMEKNASDCVQCGVCENRCPFAVKIREEMEKSVKIMSN